MKVLCTFPGRYGDLLWALPTIRAISRRIGESVDLTIAGEFSSILPLLGKQPYLGAVTADPDWPLHPEYRRPAQVPPGYDAVIHLGYNGWPQRPLPFETLDCLNEELGKLPWSSVAARWIHNTPIQDEELKLTEPWIAVPPHGLQPPWVFGFSDTHFELKYGIIQLLTRKYRPVIDGAAQLPPICVGRNVRWIEEGGYYPMTWVDAAQWIQSAKLFLGCCSALHVLAVAVGTPVVLMEPMEARWNPIFYPLGMDGPQVTMVRGLDGNPTFDLRHTRETMQAVMAKVIAAP